MRSGRNRAALRTARRRGKPHLREGVHAPARSVTWPGLGPAMRAPSAAAALECRRGFPSNARDAPLATFADQHVSGLTDADPTKSNQGKPESRFSGLRSSVFDANAPSRTRGHPMIERLRARDEWAFAGILLQSEDRKSVV